MDGRRKERGAGKERDETKRDGNRSYLASPAPLGMPKSSFNGSHGMEGDIDSEGGMRKRAEVGIKCNIPLVCSLCLCRKRMGQLEPQRLAFADIRRPSVGETA